MFKYFNYKPIKLNKDEESFEILKLIVNQIVEYDMSIYNFKEYVSLDIERIKEEWSNDDRFLCRV